MKNRLLTSTQTEYIYAVRDTLETKLKQPVNMSEILISCMSETVITALAGRLRRMYDEKTNKAELNAYKKNLKVYKGHVLSNGLLRNAIVAVKNKKELKRILPMRQKQLNQWRLSSDLIHFDAAIREPHRFFTSDPDKKGRPCIENYTALSNVLPVKSDGIF